MSFLTQEISNHLDCSEDLLIDIPAEMTVENDLELSD